MATRDNKLSKDGKPSDTLKVSAESGTDQAAMLAKVAQRPSVRAAATIKSYTKPSFGDVDLTTLVDELGTQIAAANRGDLGRAEAMLIAQAHTLEAIFHELARRAGLNMGEYLNAAEMYMRLALKAQSQCRATLETLAAIKNPPASVAFVRQANIANGPQQVNNAPPTGLSSCARGMENPQSKLLEQTNGERLDAKAPTSASRTNSQLETVATIYGTDDARR